MNLQVDDEVVMHNGIFATVVRASRGLIQIVPREGLLKGIKIYVSESSLAKVEPKKKKKKRKK